MEPRKEVSSNQVYALRQLLQFFRRHDDSNNSSSSSCLMNQEARPLYKVVNSRLLYDEVLEEKFSYYSQKNIITILVIIAAHWFLKS